MCGQSDYLWWGFSNVADQIAELSTTVRPRQFRHNGLLVLGDENRPLASDQMLLGAGWVAAHVHSALRIVFLTQK